jgi:hypothetical protein
VIILLLRPLSAHPLGYLGTVGAGAGSYAFFVLLLRPWSGERIREAVENWWRRILQRLLRQTKKRGSQ